MERERFELKVGIFVFIGVVMLGVIIVLLGSKQDLFSRQYALYAEFTEVGGLKPGAPVRLAGVDVGLVDHIDFPEPGKKNLKVEMMIKSEVRERIRQDSKASISTQGVLGDKFVAISLGSTGDPLARGATIESEQPADYFALLDTAGEATKNIASITKKIDDMLSSGAGGDAKASVSAALKNLSDVTGDIKNGNGLLHKLIYDKELAQTADNFRVASANLAAITNDVHQGKGAVGALFDPKNKAAVDKLAQAADNFEKTSENLRAVSEKINDGDGTLGALVNDDGVYDDIRALLGRAKRNRVLRTVIRHTIDKNESIEKTSVPASGDGKAPAPQPQDQGTDTP